MNEDYIKEGDKHRHAQGQGELLGGHIEGMAGNPLSSLIFREMFEGNPEERSGRKYENAILVTINRSIVLTGDDPTFLQTIARVTWGAGQGGAGRNQALVDVGAGGTSFTIGASNYLKIEIAHNVQPITCLAPATLDLSWIDASGGPRIPAFFTTRVGTPGEPGHTAAFNVPQYAARGTLIGTPAPGAADEIRFFMDQRRASILSESANPSVVPALVASGAEAFDVQGTALTQYAVIWELRL